MIYQINPTTYGMIWNIYIYSYINKDISAIISYYDIYPKQHNRCFCSLLNNNPRLLTLFERFGWKVQPRTWVHGWMKDSVWQCFFGRNFMHIWLVDLTPLKNIGQNGNIPQIGVKIKKCLNQQPPPTYIPCLNSSFLNCKVLMMSFSMAIGLTSFYFFGSLPSSKTKTPTEKKK